MCSSDLFGEWTAVRLAYPKVPETIPQQAPYRQPDAIDGGTWEAFERILRRAGYHAGGLRKIEAARQIGARFEAGNCRSPSFVSFRDALLEAVG